jgi:hypothetical protein
MREIVTGVLLALLYAIVAAALFEAAKMMALEFATITMILLAALIVVTWVGAAIIMPGPEFVTFTIILFAALIAVVVVGAAIIIVLRRRKDTQRQTDTQIQTDAQIRSTLSRPGAFQLPRDELPKLVDREIDVAKLVDFCLTNRLVFVDGESGVGKSALLRLGLPPALEKQHPEILAAYVRDLDAGGDWEQAAYSSVEQALREKLNDKKRPKGREYVLDTIERLRKKGQTPLLILDQFDDYRSNHMSSFLKDNKWLNPDELCDSNNFWKDLREQLQKETIRVIIATRTDADAQALRAVQFLGRSEAKLIPRLASHSVREMADDLVRSYSAVHPGENVISNPEATWPALLTRIQIDLTGKDKGEQGAPASATEGVLPQEVRLVLAGLDALRDGVLSVANYEDAGRAPGLAAHAVRRLIQRVADDHRLPEHDVVKMLVELSDFTGDNPVRRPQHDLFQTLGNVAQDRVAATLTALEKEGLVRRLVDPLKSDIYWQLYHRNLATPIRRIDRHLDRWSSILDSGRRKLDAAVSEEEQTAAFLSPMLQFELWRSGFKVTDKQREYVEKSRKRLRRPLAAAAAVAVATVITGVFAAKFYIEPVIGNWLCTRDLVNLGATAPSVDPSDGRIRIRFPHGVEDSTLAEASSCINYYSDRQPKVEIGFIGTKAKLNSLSQLTGVWELDIRGAGIEELPSSLAPLTALHSLKLQSIADLRPLKDLTSLEGLYLYYNNDSANLSPVGELGSLQRLYLSGKGVQTLPPLDSLGSLESCRWQVLASSASSRWMASQARSYRSCVSRTCGWMTLAPFANFRP